MNLTSSLPGYVETDCHQDGASYSFIEVAATTLGVIIILSNLLIITVITRDKKLYKGRFFCICNLAIADFLAGLLLLWIIFLQKIVLTFRTPQSELIQKGTWAVTVWSSLFNQVVIAMDRYYCIRSKRGFQNDVWGGKKRKRWLMTSLIMTWIIPISVFVFPVALSWNCLKNCSCFMPRNATENVYFMFCFPLDECSLTNPPFTKSSMLYLGINLLVIPILPCVLYAKIFKLVRSSTKRIKSGYSKGSIAIQSGEYEGNSLSTKHKVRKNGNFQHQVASPESDSSFPTSTESNDVSLHTSQSIEESRKQSKQKKSKGFCCLQLQKLNNVFHRIHCRNKRNKKSEKSSSSRKASNVSSSRFGSKRKKPELKLLRTLVIILVCYLISTLPLGVFFIVSFEESDKRHVLTAKVLLMISLLNSFINPIIYIWRFKELRKSLKSLFRFVSK